MESFCIQMTLRMKLLICNIAKLMFFLYNLKNVTSTVAVSTSFFINANVNIVLNNSKIAGITSEHKT